MVVLPEFTELVEKRLRALAYVIHTHFDMLVFDEKS